jgi:hypothetical protein
MFLGRLALCHVQPELQKSILSATFRLAALAVSYPIIRRVGTPGQPDADGGSRFPMSPSIRLVDSAKIDGVTKVAEPRVAFR